MHRGFTVSLIFRRVLVINMPLVEMVLVAVRRIVSPDQFWLYCFYEALLMMYRFHD